MEEYYGEDDYDDESYSEQGPSDLSSSRENGNGDRRYQGRDHLSFNENSGIEMSNFTNQNMVSVGE